MKDKLGIMKSCKAGLVASAGLLQTCHELIAEAVN